MDTEGVRITLTQDTVYVTGSKVWNEPVGSHLSYGFFKLITSQTMCI